jgi:2-polyprenyl-3-methyl-5-hydroxy-6-metoxy-1,4-benzoquinol methylase
MKATFITSALKHCPVCSAQEREAKWIVPPANVYQCRKCHHYYIDPCLDNKSMAEAYLNTESLMQLHHFHDGYYEYTDINRPSQTLSEFSFHLEHLQKFLPPAQRKLFDIGYGNGLFLAYAQRNHWIVDGIDTSPYNKIKAKENFNLDLRVGFFEKNKEMSGHYDAVTLLDVIEHITEPLPFLQNAGELLSENGILLLAVPHENSLLKHLGNILYLLSRGKITFGLDKQYVLEHVSYFNLQTMTFLLNKSGLEVIDHYYSSTDLAKYKLSPLERTLGSLILFFGKLMRLQNRMIVLARKKE